MNIKPLNYICSLCFNEVEEKNVVIFEDCDGRSHYICGKCALAICDQHHSILAQVNDIANREASKSYVTDFVTNYLAKPIKEEK